MSERTSLRFEVEAFAKNVIRVVSEAMRENFNNFYKNNENFLIDLEKKITDLQKKIDDTRSTVLDAQKRKTDAETRLKNLDALRDRKLAEGEKYQNKAEKYEREKKNLERLTPGTREYSAQEKRLEEFRESFEKYAEIIADADKISDDIIAAEEELEKAEKEYEKYEKKPGEQNPMLHTIKVSWEKKLKHMQNLRDTVKNLSISGADSKIEEIYQHFNSENFIRDITDSVLRTISVVTNHAFFDETQFSENQQYEFLEFVLNDDPIDSWKEFDLMKVLSSNEEFYVEVDGRPMFDINLVSMDDVDNTFFGFFNPRIRNSALKALEPYKWKRDRIIPEAGFEDEEGDASSLYDMYEGGLAEENAFDAPHEQRHEYADEELPSDWSPLRDYLNEELEDMARTTVKAIRSQLEIPFFSRSQEQDSIAKMKEMYSTLIRQFSSELERGRPIGDRMRPMVRRSLGYTVPSTQFQAVFNIIYSVVQYNVCTYLYDMVHEKYDQGEENGDEEAMLVAEKMMERLDEKVDLAMQGIKDYSKVKVARRIHRIARKVVEELEASTPEQKVDFLLKGEPVNDGSGYYRQGIVNASGKLNK